MDPGLHQDDASVFANRLGMSVPDSGWEAKQILCGPAMPTDVYRAKFPTESSGVFLHRLAIFAPIIYPEGNVA